MERGELFVARSVIAGLYLRGCPNRPRLQRYKWGLVRDALALHHPNLSQVADVLRTAGLYDESSCISVPGVLDWGVDQIQNQRAVTVVCPHYPKRLIATLRGQSPPALWVAGTLAVGRFVAVAGVRDATHADNQLAHEIGKSIVTAGYHCVTGGAIGCDSAAVAGSLLQSGGGRSVVILPFGLNYLDHGPGVCYLSACAPNTRFTAGQAQERNVLTYAMADLAIIVRSHYRRGGTWNGATECLRRHLSPLAVMTGASSGPDDPAATLCRLGAIGMSDIDSVRVMLSHISPAQLIPGVFGDDTYYPSASAQRTHSNIVREVRQQWQQQVHLPHHLA